MCSYADHPYTTGIVIYPDQPMTIISGYVLTSPIRDKVVCMSGPAESHVILVGNEQLSAYVDVYVVAIQVLLVAILLIGLPILLVRKFKKRKIAIVSTILGIVFSAVIICATTNHVGWQLVLPWMIGALIIMLVPSRWIYRKTPKSAHELLA